MAIIKAPPKQPKSVTIQARVEESVKTQLDQYAKFIDSTPSYVITEALKVLFKRDDEFKAWLGQHADDQNPEQNQGEALTKTARPVQPNSVRARIQRRQDSMPGAAQ
jgi:predicted transcriptional regulator